MYKAAYTNVCVCIHMCVYVYVSLNNIDVEIYLLMGETDIK